MHLALMWSKSFKSFLSLFIIKYSRIYKTLTYDIFFLLSYKSFFQKFFRHRHQGNWYIFCVKCYMFQSKIHLRERCIRDNLFCNLLKIWHLYLWLPSESWYIFRAVNVKYWARQCSLFWWRINIFMIRRYQHQCQHNVSFVFSSKYFRNGYFEIGLILINFVMHMHKTKYVKIYSFLNYKMLCRLE